MKSWSSVAGTIAFLVAIPPVLSAQWPAYPNASVPRTPDGKPNLSAPAPRTPDGKPDLSGIWNNQFFGGPSGRLGSGPTTSLRWRRFSTLALASRTAYHFSRGPRTS